MAVPAFNTVTPSFTTQQLPADNLIITMERSDNEAVLKLNATPYKRGMVLGQITASGLYTQALSASGDGSQVPCAILLDDIDATLADTKGPVMLQGQVMSRGLILGTGITALIAKSGLRGNGIFVKGSVSAADPT
jgi:Bacteriophage lambda head decoration protein D